MKIIGIVGHPASGKDTAADFFIAHGFRHISTGDFLRHLMREKNIPTDRAHIHEFSKEMREKNGNGFPVGELSDSITGITAVSGLRNNAEVDILRKKFNKDFTLLAITAPERVRYERIRARRRVGDDISFERFKEEEDQERQEASGSHEVDKVIAAADVIIENRTSKESFLAQLEKFLA